MMKQLQVTITTKSPLVITAESSSQVLTESKNYISGTIVRGILADAYIKNHDRKDQKLRKKAHEDATFKQLFLGGLQFQAAYPVVAGHRSYPLPQSLMKPKGEGDIIDILEAPGKPGYKVLKGLGYIDSEPSKKDQTIYMAEVDKKIHFHMSRSSESERFAGRSNGGGIYNYEAIGEGQSFEAVISGEEEDLIQLIRGLELEDYTLKARVGKAKRTSYGQCEIQFGDLIDCETDVSDEWVKTLREGKLAIRLDSPFISNTPTTGWRRNEEDSLVQDFVNALQEAIPNQKVSLKKLFTGAEVVRNYVGVWQLHRPEELALVAGSVFTFDCSRDWSDADLKALKDVLMTGVGGRKEEGFGQIRPWVLPPSFEIAPVDKDSKQVADVRELSKATRKLMRTILKTQDIESIRSQAYVDVQYNKSQLQKADNHTFARLENYVPILANQKGSISDDDKASLKKIFETNWKANGLFIGNQQMGKFCDVEEMLKNFKVPEWIIAIGETHQGLRELVNGKQNVEQQEKQDELYFVEYWTWFFKYARKL